MVFLYDQKSRIVFLLVTLFSAITHAQDVQEFEQGFEDNAPTPWNFTPTPAPYEVGEDAWTNTPQNALITPANGSAFWYMRDLDNENGGFAGFHTLDFEAIDVSGFPFSSIIFQYYTVGYEIIDSIGYILAYDGADFDMANYVDLDRNTEAWEVVFINLPSGVNSVSLRLMAKQNGGSDFAGFDQVTITSSDIDLFSPQILDATLVDQNTVRIRYNESMNQASVENIGNYTASTTISDISYTDAGDGSSYVDINYAAPFVDGQSNAITVGFVADLSGNVHGDGFTFNFIYNNSTPALVITEIMYNPPSTQDLEFIEVYNASSEMIAIGGLKILAGNEISFPELDLASGEVILIALDKGISEAFYGMDFLDWGVNSLNNGGGQLLITNFSGQIIDEVNYNDVAPWPVEADGNGPSLELIAPNLDNSLGINWRATTTPFEGTELFATPGTVSEDLVPQFSFDEPVLYFEETDGIQSINISISNANTASSLITVSEVTASTAIEGEDYLLSMNTLEFFPDGTITRSIDIELLDNNKLGGKYLILELFEAINAGLGSNTRLIILIQDNDDVAPVAEANPYLQVHHLGSFDLEGNALAEIVAHDGESKRLFVTNAENNTLEILDYSDPAALALVNTVDLSSFGGGVNSVAVYEGLVAVAVQAETVDGNGVVLFLDVDGLLLHSVETGVLPDMVTFTPDGNTVLTANEGEPSDDYTIDPEGSITIIDISSGVASATANTIGFTDFNSQQANLIEQGVRIFGPGATVAQDLEPEYIAIADDGAFAYVVCQENNAVAIIDIAAQAVNNILSLGTKNWTAEGVTFDASDRTDDIFFANWPIKGIYQPDAIDYFNTGGAGYLITTNGGDARDYDSYSEEFRVKDDEIALDPIAFPDAAYLKNDALLGRLKVTAANGDTDGDGDYDELYAYGARSFSIWNATTAELVYDSDNDLEQITAADPVFGALFNSDDEENDFMNRSDDKGPEPEAVVIAEIDGGQYAFIGLERVGGMMVYDVTDPENPVYLQYINTRTIDSLGGDLSPEGLAFIPAIDSPTGQPLLTVANEVSGTIGVFELQLSCPITSLPDEVIVCDGDIALLEVAGQYADIEWSNGEMTPSIVVEEAGTYTVMATTEGGCMASDIVTVTYVPIPVLDLPDMIGACEGTSILLNAGDFFEFYEWNTGDTTQTIEVTTSDTYRVTVTDTNGCQAFDEINVVFNPLPIVNFPLDTIICSTDVYIYEAGDSNIMIINGQEVEYFSTEGLDIGTYTIEAIIINEAGCEIIVTLSFTIDVCGRTSEQLAYEKVEVFPNPATGIATIVLSRLQNEAYTLDINTATGQLVQQFTFQRLKQIHQQEIDLSEMPSGVYFIRLYNESGSSLRRLLLE